MEGQEIEIRIRKSSGACDTLHADLFLDGVFVVCADASNSSIIPVLELLSKRAVHSESVHIAKDWSTTHRSR